MWETIRLNLILNLSLDKDSLSFKKTIDEKKLSELLISKKILFISCIFISVIQLQLEWRK